MSFRKGDLLSKISYILLFPISIGLIGTRLSWNCTRLSKHDHILTDRSVLAYREDSEAPNVAICSVVKNQAEDIVEWVLYHMMLGVGVIYIFDHNSTTPMVNELLPFIKTGNVVYQYFKQVPLSSKLNPQLWAYQQCINAYWDRHHFIAFIDADEFIVINKGYGDQSLPTFLKKFESFGALGINWRVMGSDNHTSRPSGGALENYLSCFPQSETSIQRHIKSIVNTKFNATVSLDPHHFAISGANTVDAFGETIDGPFHDKIPLEPIALQHYLFKSREDFNRKSQRGSGDGGQKTMEFFELSLMATHQCPWGKVLSQRVAMFKDKNSDILKLVPRQRIV